MPTSALTLYPSHMRCLICVESRYKAGVRNLWSSPPYSVAVSSVRESVVAPDGQLTTRTYSEGEEGVDVQGGVGDNKAEALPLPMLCSHCPGKNPRTHA
jgi:hypothetical protein